MSRRIFSLSILLLSYLLLETEISAQKSAPDEQILSPVTIEFFVWYAENKAAEPKIANFFRRNLPEGESKNFPPSDSSRKKEPGKIIYRLILRNLSDKEITMVVWRYEFFNPTTRETAASIEFQSPVRIKPNKRKTIYADSVMLPAQTIDVSLFLLNKEQPFLESVSVKSLVFKENAGK